MESVNSQYHELSCSWMVGKKQKNFGTSGWVRSPRSAPGSYFLATARSLRPANRATKIHRHVSTPRLLQFVHFVIITSTALPAYYQ